MAAQKKAAAKRATGKGRATHTRQQSTATRITSRQPRPLTRNAEGELFLNPVPKQKTKEDK